MYIPIPMTVSPAYKKGFEDGKKQAIEEIPELANKENEIYNDGYNKGLEDGYKGHKYLNQWFIDTCFFEDEDNLFPEYKRRQDDTCCLEDIITDVGFSEVLKRVKAYEENKKAEEYSIKVGDEVKSVYNNLSGVVTKVNPGTEKIRILFCDGSASIIECFFEDYEKTGRHFDEVEQLLDKLGGKE